MKINDYLKNMTILYVEDEDSIRETFSLVLQEYFKKIYVAKNGKEGLELYKKYNPDIIITDIKIPIIDGIEMSKQIKKINPDSLIIIISASYDKESLSKAIDIGVDAYLTKPIKIDKLFEKLNFFAEIIKNKKEKEELFYLLQEIFNNQQEAVLLLKDNKIILQNDTFKLFFNSYSIDILKHINLDKEIQKLNIDEKTYKISIKKLENYTLIYFLDITDYENEIFKDSLTKLYNRKILLKLLKESINNTICLIMLDIDNFKRINDTYGHLQGDEVLKKISETLKNTLRKEDTIIRWGGEEFLIFLKNIEDKNLTKEIAEKLRKNIENTNFEKVGKVTSSFGVCCDKLKNRDYFDKILDKTDKALYEAKNNGKNQVRICKE